MLIEKVSIKGFRSLKDLTIENFEDVNVFHGLNNTGKSNILAFLEIIFQRKLQDAAEGKRPVTFTKGIVENFQDNFFKDSKDNITFHITLIASSSELDLKYTADFYKKLLIDTGKNKIQISGEINRQGQDSALFLVSSVKLNDTVLFSEVVGESAKVEYFPATENVENSEKQRVVEYFLSQFNDAVKIISSRRFLTDEVEDHTDGFAGHLGVSAEHFKNWLFKMSLERMKNNTYHKIKKWFNSPPFCFGEISFARYGGHIDIMVNKGGLSLPIGRLGSGAQQLLILLSQIADCNSKIIGIEELEINLAPELQAKVLSNLRKWIRTEEVSINQLFITSHSERYYPVDAIKKYLVFMPNDSTSVDAFSAASRTALIGDESGGLWEP